MILDATTKSLEIILAGAVTTNQLEVVSDWTDMTVVAGVTGTSNTGIVTNGATAVTAVAAPAAGTARKINELTVFNADTVAATVTVRINDNATMRRKFKTTLQPGYTLSYSFTDGWMVTDTNGLIQMGQTSVFSIPSAIAGYNLQTGTTYTLALSDAGCLVDLNNAASISLTIPPNAGVAFAANVFCLARQKGAGQVTFVAGAGVTLRSPAGGAVTIAQYDIRGLVRIGATDEWNIL